MLIVPQRNNFVVLTSTVWRAAVRVSVPPRHFVVVHQQHVVEIVAVGQRDMVAFASVQSRLPYWASGTEAASGGGDHLSFGLKLTAAITSFHLCPKRFNNMVVCFAAPCRQHLAW